MAKGITALTITSGLTALYNALNDQGFITTLVGSVPGATGSLVFYSSKLCQNSDTYIRIRLAGASTTANNRFAMDIGTVSGTTFTPTKNISVYSSSDDFTITNMDLIYDTDNDFICISEYGAFQIGHMLWLGKLDNDYCVCGALSYVTTRSLGTYYTNALSDEAALTLITAKNTIKSGGYYLEEDVWCVDSNFNLLKNGEVPAKLKGIKSLALVATTNLTADASNILFYFPYQGNSTSDAINTYFKLALS